MAPSISIRAVWRPSDSMSELPKLKSKYAQIATNASTRKDSLKKMLQRREARCSRTVANTRRSSVSRSQLLKVARAAVRAASCGLSFLVCSLINTW
jgi:hypothetical protein